MILNLEKSCNNSLEKSYTLFILFSLMFINFKKNYFKNWNIFKLVKF